MGTSKLIDSSTASLFEVPGSNSPLVVQGLQIGGASASCRGLVGLFAGGRLHSRAAQLHLAALQQL